MLTNVFISNHTYFYVTNTIYIQCSLQIMIFYIRCRFITIHAWDHEKYRLASVSWNFFVPTLLLFWSHVPSFSRPRCLGYFPVTFRKNLSDYISSLPLLELLLLKTANQFLLCWHFIFIYFYKILLYTL